MKKLCGFALVCLCFAALSGAQQPDPAAGGPRRPVRFEALDITIDPDGQPLAAYQLELAAERGDVKIVGIEGGETPAFATPPYYDPAALQNHRIIIAAFATGGDLPAARTRVARLHLHVEGDAEPEYAIRLRVAASPDGKRIPATATIQRRRKE